MEPPKKPTPQPTPQLPRLSILDRSKTPHHTFIHPAKLINDGPDVAHFLVSQGYRDIGLFVLQLARALCPRKGDTRIFTLASPRRDPPSVTRLQQLLEAVDVFIDETPPEPGPRRFGNAAFRAWYKLLERRVEGLLGEFVAPEVLGGDEGKGGVQDETETETETEEAGKPAAAMDELKAYFLGSFGSAQRLDYGTGHEMSFLAFLGCLWKLGAFRDGDGSGDGEEGDIERSIALGVFEPYLKVIRRLILTYTLEPAGSHGVWGLDDHSFLPYVFGSAQLARPVGPGEPLPIEGSALHAPKPADVLDADIVGGQRELNMYFSAVGFVNDVKKGPFWEHSPILFDISGIKDGWGKINKGMIRMFNAEVLSKYPVVQHFPFGSLFSWDIDPEAAIAPPPQSVHMANQPSASTAPGSIPYSAGTAAQGGPVGTAAPWAQATRMPGPTGPGIPYSRVAPAPPGMTTARPPGRTGASRVVGPAGARGTTDAQIPVTKAPWARDGG